MKKKQLPSPQDSESEPPPPEPNTSQQPAESSLAKLNTIRCPRRHYLWAKLESLPRRSVVLGGGILFLLFTLLGSWLYGISFPYFRESALFKHPAPTVAKPLLIAVMGMTGVGKSTFIKELTKDANITVGFDLESCTEAVQHSSLSWQTESGTPYNVILADTPGFDDSRSGRTDAGILEEIADWLEDMYDHDTKLTGIIYLYRITDDRLGGSSARNLRMMRDLVGEGNMRNVMLVTTRWELVANNPDELSKAETRELQLRNNTNGKEGFWYDLITTHGASYARHDGSYNSAASILSRIVENSPVFIQLQKELAQGIKIIDTTAGNSVLSSMERESLLYAKRVERMEKEMRKQEESRVRLEKKFQEALEMLNTEREKGRQEAIRTLLAQIIQERAENEREREETREDYEKLTSRIRLLEEELKRLRERESNRGPFARFGEKMDNIFT